MTKKAPKVNVSADKLVIITDDHGGYTAGQCVVCGNVGWLVEKRYGLPFGSRSQDNAMRHAKTCPMNNVLTSEGEWRKSRQLRANQLV